MRFSRLLSALFAVLVVGPPFGGAASRVQASLLRMRLVLTTASPVAELTIDGGTIIHASNASPHSAARIHADGNRLSFTHDGSGAAEANVRLLVSGVDARARVTWHLTLTPSGAPAQIEIYNENEPNRTRIVDRFEATARESRFESPADALMAGGPVRLAPGPGPLVLAFFYPWYHNFDWDSDELLDRPLVRYSSEIPEQVGRSIEAARAAGLDGLVVSWRGDTDWNDRRLQIVLDKAQTLGLKVSILVETLLATEGPEGTVKPLSADKLRTWLEKAHDVFGPHPAFLKVDGRPVVFVYVAGAFTPAQWVDIVGALACSRRNPFLMADSLDPAFLESFAGAFTYATALLPRSSLQAFYNSQAIRTQSYNLSYGGERRVDAATVSPGYDDSHLDRERTFVVGRDNGGLYDAEWQAAVRAQPDWILVTSWNEFWENTHIEPSELYGHWYQTRTRAWTRALRRQANDDGQPLSSLR